MVREAGGWDEPNAADALDELLDRKLVADAGGYGDFDYAFAHQMVRDVVAGLSPERRAPDRHRRIARALETLHSQRLAEFAAQVARHYDLAGDPKSAASRYLLAARRALQMVALEESRANVQRGLELAVDPHVRVELYVEACRLAQRSDDRAERAAALAGLDEAANILDDVELHRTAALFRVQFSATDGDAAAHRRALERPAGSRGRRRGPGWRAELLIREASAARARGDLAAARAASEAAVSAAREHGDPATIARALPTLAHVRIDEGDLEGAQAAAQEAQELAFRAGDGVAELHALHVAHRAAIESSNDLEGALVIGERWLERARALGDRNAEAFARMRCALTLLYLRRDLRRARTELAVPLAIFEELGSRYGVARVRANRGVFESALGDFAKSVESFDQAYVDFEATGDVPGQINARSNSGLARAYAGDPGRGHRDALAALRLVRKARNQWVEAFALENVAATNALRGDFHSAVRFGRQALAMHERDSRGSDIRSCSGNSRCGVPVVETSRRRESASTRSSPRAWCAVTSSLNFASGRPRKCSVRAVKRPQPRNSSNVPTAFSLRWRKR